MTPLESKMVETYSLLILHKKRAFVPLGVSEEVQKDVYVNLIKGGTIAKVPDEAPSTVKEAVAASLLQGEVNK